PAGALRQLLDEGPRDRPLDEDALDADAGLAAVEEGAEDRAVRRALDVRVREHEQRILAAQLEHHRATPRSGGRGDAPAVLDRAGEEDLVDPRAGDQRLADGAVPGHELDELRGRSRFVEDPPHPLTRLG